MASATTNPPTLQSLPAELVLEIAERLEADGDISALRNLSSTCRTFRRYFDDAIASRVTFTHRDNNSSRNLAMVRTHGRNITKLRFFDSIPMYTLPERLEREEEGGGVVPVVACVGPVDCPDEGGGGQGEP